MHYSMLTEYVVFQQKEVNAHVTDFGYPNPIGVKHAKPLCQSAAAVPDILTMFSYLFDQLTIFQGKMNTGII